MSAISVRYQLPKKSIKTDCPNCGAKHRKTLSRYVDTTTGELLPEIYGRCDRESNCGYHLNPYNKDASGKSYADEIRQLHNMGPIPKAWFRMAGKQKRNGVSRSNIIQTLIQMEGARVEQAERVVSYILGHGHRKQTAKAANTDNQEQAVYCIPEEVFQQSLGHYERNQFAILLRQHFGDIVANDLLKRFYIGTSSRWPGACIFWYIDEQGRKRGGQIKLFDNSFHTVRYVDRNGEKRSKTSWVHSAYALQCDQQQSYPTWLSAYINEENNVQKSPCLFGLPQIYNTSIDKPIAIVEAPKTAIICTHYFPEYIWMATGALSFLKRSRIMQLLKYNIVLFPDLSKDGSAITCWNCVAKELNANGFQIRVSTFLEDNSTQEEKAAGLDLADFLLKQKSLRT